MATFTTTQDVSVQVYDQFGYHTLVLTAGTHELSDSDAALLLAYAPQAVGSAPAAATVVPAVPSVVAPPAPPAPVSVPADAPAPAPVATPNEV